MSVACIDHKMEDYCHLHICIGILHASIQGCISYCEVFQSAYKVQIHCGLFWCLVLWFRFIWDIPTHARIYCSASLVDIPSVREVPADVGSSAVSQKLHLTWVNFISISIRQGFYCLVYGSAYQIFHKCRLKSNLSNNHFPKSFLLSNFSTGNILYDKCKVGQYESNITLGLPTALFFPEHFNFIVTI